LLAFPSQVIILVLTPSFWGILLLYSFVLRNAILWIYSTNSILPHGIMSLGLDPNPSRRSFRTARPWGEIDLRRVQRHPFRHWIQVIPLPSSSLSISRSGLLAATSSPSPWRTLDGSGINRIRRLKGWRCPLRRLLSLRVCDAEAGGG
jgi:hypothetical protein